MEMDPTIVALRRFEEAEMAYTAFTGTLLESGVTIPPDLRAQAKALRVALDGAAGRLPRSPPGVGPDGAIHALGIDED